VVRGSKISLSSGNLYSARGIVLHHIKGSWPSNSTILKIAASATATVLFMTGADPDEGGAQAH
jgi:hypothetical protein